MVSTFRKNTALLFFVVKRLGIVTGILLAVSTGFFHDTAHTEVAAYYSTFATPYASSATESHQLRQVTPPIKKTVIVSEEIIQKVVPTSTPTPTPAPWGKSRQIDEHTWTIDVGRDDHMGTPQEIASALNVYRRQKGEGSASKAKIVMSFWGIVIEDN